MILSKAALIFVLAPLVSFPATLISHTRQAHAEMTVIPDPVPVIDTESTLLTGYALLEAGVNPEPSIAASSKLESVISSNRFEVFRFSAGASSTDSAVARGAGSAIATLEVLFELSEAETWFLDVFFDPDGFSGDGGAGTILSLRNLTDPGAGFNFISSPVEPIFESNKKLLLPPGTYQLKLDASAGGGPNGFGGGTSGSFRLAQSPIPEPSTYLSVSAALAALLLSRRQRVRR